MASRLPELIFLAGDSNPQLSKSICEYDGFKLSKMLLRQFANKELFCKIEQSMRGEDVFILQTAGPIDPNKDMMELFMIAHTAKKASARRVTAVIPYIYGSRQDRKSETRTPITIQMMGELLKASGVDKIITVSIHNAASVGSFGSIVVDNISSFNVFTEDLKKLYAETKFCVYSPDAGGVPRAKAYANYFGADLGFAYKSRSEANKIKDLVLVGDVKGRTVLVVDDMVDTGGTHIKFAEEALKMGAKDVYLCVTHAILSKDAKQKIQDSSIKRVFTTDTVYHSDLPEKFVVKSMGPVLAEAILRCNSDKSFEGLFLPEEEK